MTDFYINEIKTQLKFKHNFTSEAVLAIMLDCESQMQEYFDEEDQCASVLTCAQALSDAYLEQSEAEFLADKANGEEASDYQVLSNGNYLCVLP